jgi:hypothetical protein
LISSELTLRSDIRCSPPPKQIYRVIALPSRMLPLPRRISFPLNSSVFHQKKGRVTTRALSASPKTSLEACSSYSTPHIDIAAPVRFSRSLLLLTRGIRLGAPFLVLRPHFLGPSTALSLRGFGCPVYSLNCHIDLPGLAIFSSILYFGGFRKNFRIIFSPEFINRPFSTRSRIVFSSI